MKTRTTIVLAVLALTVAVVLGTAALGLGGPLTPTDQTKVPHYFGPYSNYANSPFTQAAATVTIAAPGGSGTPAEATATVGANGAVTGITITNPGSGYAAAPTVTIGGAGSGASALATVSLTGSVTSVLVNSSGGGFTKPTVVISGGGGTGATATAFGEVDVLTFGVAGSGYQRPTVAFDLPDDPNGTQPTAHVTCVELNCAPVSPATTVTINDIVLDSPGSGYSAAPGVAILDGTQFDPVPNGGTGATATATLKVMAVTLDTFGSGYTSAPNALINDATGSGSGAVATAVVNTGAVTGITNLVGGSGYLTPGGIKKFQDDLPGLCNPAVSGSCPTAAGSKYIPLGVPDTASYVTSDTYEIGLVQYRTSFSSQLPSTLVRGYVQIETPANVAISQHFPLVNEMLTGAPQPIRDAVGAQVYGVTPPQYLGPTIVATKDRPVRIVFHNYLPIGVGGNLFLPVDTTIMGAGMGPLASQTPPMDLGTVMDEARNPMCGEPGVKPAYCFVENRATLHLHGGTTPWISDGTPHQWITPAGESTDYPKGVSVYNVPDMGDPGPGAQTFFYTNQQSARLMFYHDHAWGITRLNVYAGEAAGYLITDATEQKLIGPGGALDGLGYGIPLIIQDKTFVPDLAQIGGTDPAGAPGNFVPGQDPTWDASRWGGKGSLWMPHVYMPAQNPGDPSGMSAFGRWMYGPWFWPPASPPHGPIANPYYNAACNPAIGFCEPELIPGTPNITVGMEAFNDTPIVNGMVYPKQTLDPKSYRLRILNAANDRFWNLQWYVADPTTGTLSEVALKPAELLAAQTDPVVFPTVDESVSPAGPSWIQIGTEGGFLPAPAVIPNQVTTWITDPTRFDVGNVDKHSLLLAPGERADTVVDFSKYAGKTLILYNDAPAAFPARVPSYDYYTGGPDLSPVGAPTTLPGYGPNTRTIMQVTINAGTNAPFDLAKLNAAFKHHFEAGKPAGVFESGQHPIIVGQAPYNSAYGTGFVASGWCNAPGTLSPTKCDGYARIQEGSQPVDKFGFNALNPTLAPGVGKLQIPFQPKGMHDEANSTSFDEYGRMQATLGLEAPGANPLLQNIILYPYVNPSSELIDATNLPKGDVVQPISSAADGTQIWKITHNGVDTHPIHFHLYDVQIINRVTWDNIIIPPDANELGWKDTIRLSPLEDTYIALRPIIPTVPWELPNSVRVLNPMMPLGSTLGFNNVDAKGNPTTAIVNTKVNFGWEYVYHCHILSHEEMDMMRPVSVAIPPNAPSGLGAATGTVIVKNKATTVLNLTWTDNSINETRFLVQRMNGAGTWVTLATLDQPLVQDTTTGKGARTYTDTTYVPGTTYRYRVVAQNVVGYGGAYMQMTVQSISNVVGPPAGTTVLNALTQTATKQPVVVSWTYTPAGDIATGFRIQRATNLGFTTGLTTFNVGVVPNYADGSVKKGTTYYYRVAPTNILGVGGWSTPILSITAL